MKKTVTILLTLFALAAQAITVNEASGTYKGMLNIGGEVYPDKEVYILPGTDGNAITFVLPDFQYGAASLGDIVLVNLPMNADGQLILEGYTLYIRAISERATISVINGLEDGGTVYNSFISANETQVLLSIAAPSLPEPILVLFAGNRVSNKNYAITNGGFEGAWSNNEPSGWHSFPSATGSYSSFVTGNTDQCKRSTDVRPGSNGSQSIMLASNMVAGAKANGNCTNGRINAGSTSAGEGDKNYNFSDPSANGYNTAFVGNPDSLVFWAKYIPADENPSNEVNIARAHAVITTNARYQDPESGDYSAVKIAEAGVNYGAADMNWQRLAVPFSYTAVNPSSAAYILLTFTTNMTPGGGSTYSTGGLFNKTYYYDNLYLDDAEIVYNHALSSFQLDGAPVTFTNGQAASAKLYSDSEYTVQATTNGKAAKSFIGYDAANYRIYIYVVADNYSQARAYSLYTIQMAAPVRDTEYAYTAPTCDNEPYSDELFQNLTEPKDYHTTIPNTQGGDSLITLTLTVLPTYTFPSEATIKMNGAYEWRDKTFQNLSPGVHTFADSLQTAAGCDSVFTLTLTVESIGYEFEETTTACQGETSEWHNKPLPTAQTGTFIVYDSLQSIYGTDSVYQLTLTVYPTYLFTEEKYVNEANLEWRGKTIQDLPKREEPYLIYDSLTSQNGCDSVYLLRLHVSEVPVTYGHYADSCCGGECILFDGVEYCESFEGDIHLSERNRFGGDSIVHLTIIVFPSYYTEEEMTITVGEARTWEYYDLSQLPIGSATLKAQYWSENNCDSIKVLHLTVKPQNNGAGEDQQTDNPCIQILRENGMYTPRQ